MKQKLYDLKEFILLHNPYFDMGFSDVVLDDTTGYVHNDEPVFPADNLGNYFYLRLPNQVRYDYTRPPIADNYISVGKASNIFLVACVRDADPDKLIANLEMTIGRYQDLQIKLVQSTWQKEVVVLQELAGIEKENIQAALQRLPKDTAIVSISFTATYDAIFQNLNCITNPCTTC